MTPDELRDADARKTERAMLEARAGLREIRDGLARFGAAVQDSGLLEQFPDAKRSRLAHDYFTATASLLALVAGMDEIS